MKQQIANILRKAGLIYITDYWRFILMRSRNRSRNKAFLAAHPDVAFPPPYMIYETFRLDYERYYRSGRDTAEWIRKEVTAFRPFEQLDILDWGCGPGRVIRHMPALAGPGCRFWACDYNPAYVRWCADHIPGIVFRENGLQPPLPFDSGQMDLVYGLSILTHLSAAMHEAWTTELLRVLRPGGILFLTTHGDITRQNLIPEELAQYDRGELVTRANVKEGHRMYVAYHPPAFMERLFGDRVKILAHRPGKQESWGLQQDLWILGKK